MPEKRVLIVVSQYGHISFIVPASSNYYNSSNHKIELRYLYHNVMVCISYGNTVIETYITRVDILYDSNAGIGYTN